MSQPFVGEIRMFGGNFAPAGWAFCNGQLMSIAENDVLFTLIGTTYGGDGQETFGIPDLQGRAPLHFGQGSGLSNYVQGEAAGVETVTISTQQLPNHTHTMVGSTAQGLQSAPGNQVVAATTGADIYTGDDPTTAMSPNAIAPVGGSQPHDNMQQYLVVSYIISLFGIFPSQT